MSEFLKRIIRLNIGTMFYALGIVITMRANVGFAPWEVFHWGVAQTIGLTIGVVSIIVSLILCVITVLLREKVGLGTVLNMILMGIYIDLLLSLGVIPQMNGLVSGIIMLIIGLFTVSFGTYFYMSSGFGAGPRDSLMVAVKRKTKLPVGLCRGALELIVVFVGWLLGGLVGVGTVIAAFGISFCIQLVFSLMKFEPTSVKNEALDVTYKRLRQLFRGKDG